MLVLVKKKFIPNLVKTFLNKWRELLMLSVFFIGMLALYVENLLRLASFRFYIMIFIILATILCFLPKKIEMMVFVVIVTMGSISAYLSPIFDIPDEPVHYARSLYLSEGDLNLSNDLAKLQISKDYAALKSEMGVTIKESQLKDSYYQSTEFSSEDLQMTGPYWNISYFPQAVGLLVGRWLHLNIVYTFLLGRICNVFAYAILAYFAVKISKRLEQIMALVVLMPMSIYLSGSYNQDAVAMGTVYLLIAYFIHLLAKKTIVEKDLIFYFFISAIIITMKLPYVLLFFLLFFLPYRYFESSKKWILLVLNSILIMLLTVGWYKLYSQIQPIGLIGMPVLEGVDAGEQVAHIIAHPLHVLLVFIRSLFLSISTISGSMTYGWLSYGTSDIFVVWAIIATIISMNNLKKVYMSFWTRLGLVLIAVGLIMGIHLSMYITWTPVGATFIQGVQGRYLLGVIPLLLLAMVTGTKADSIEENASYSLLKESTVSCMMFLMVATMIFSTMLRYY